MKKAFTLIELLVVIAIIAILAAILFPVFAQAKQSAKFSAELAQAKQIGIALQIYLADNDDTYMSANVRLAANGSSAEGEVDWTYVLLPYVKNVDIFASPADSVGGWAPTCWNPADNNQGKGAPSGQTSRCDLTGYNAGIFTLQVPRKSWTANQMIMPRKRRAADTTNVISSTVIDDVSGTILLTRYTESANCMRSTDGEFRTYRPTFAVRDSANLTNSFSSALPATSQLWALTKDEVTAIHGCNAGTAGTPEHVFRFANPGRFKNGNNYVFADTSAKFRSLDSTISTRNFAWGKVGYSIGGASVLDRATGQPVQ